MVARLEPHLLLEVGPRRVEGQVELGRPAGEPVLQLGRSEAQHRVVRVDGDLGRQGYPAGALVGPEHGSQAAVGGHQDEGPDGGVEGRAPEVRTFTLYRQFSEHQPTEAARQEYARWLGFESAWLRAYDAVWTMSPEDRAAALAEGSPAGRTWVVANGVDLDRFQPADEATAAPEVFYVGSFRHLPNIIAFEALRDEVMPRVWSRFPEARLRVVAGPEPEHYWHNFRQTDLPRALDRRIEMHGFVEDLRPLYARAAVVAVPLLVSAGTNIKVMEAMACRKAVVSTPVGCQGLDLTDGSDALIRSNWPEFAEAIAGLLADETCRARIAARARETVERRFGWEAIADEAYRTYRTLVEHEAAAPLRGRGSGAGGLEYPARRVKQVRHQPTQPLRREAARKAYPRPPAPVPRPPAFLKRLLFRLLRKDPDAIVVSFLSGDPALASRMADEVRRLEPARRHFTVAPRPGSAWQIWRALRREFSGFRIGLAPVLFTSEPSPLRLAAFLLAPRKVLAYNARLERHHLRLRTALASLLFLRGVPVDRIFLRPRWLCPCKRDRSTAPAGVRVVEGRPPAPGRKRIAVLSPYYPYPLSHGGAVRMWNLLREAARDFDITLFAFTDGPADPAPAAAFCARVVLVEKPRYREPRWSTLLPPEVHEFRSPAMRDALARYGADCELRQVEYTQLAPYGGDILVEHDVTFDLFGQVWRRDRTLSAWWDWFRWRRFERRAVARFRRVVVMSGKDRALLGSGSVIENGVDLARYQPQPETPGARLLFIGSFRHFPNVAAYRFFVDEVWPGLRARFPAMTLTVVAGPDHLSYWQAFTNQLAPAPDERIRILGYVADVRPLYVEANLVVVPTTVSAGTNVKVLEAMAMERAVVSTPSGCAGLGLEHGRSVWVASTAEEFAAGVAELLEDPATRAQIAHQARQVAGERFDWRALGEKQRALWATAG